MPSNLNMSVHRRQSLSVAPGPRAIYTQSFSLQAHYNLPSSTLRSSYFTCAILYIPSLLLLY